MEVKGGVQATGGGLLGLRPRSWGVGEGLWGGGWGVGGGPFSFLGLPSKPKNEKGENAVFDFFGSGGPKMHDTPNMCKQVDFCSSERSSFLAPLAPKRTISPKSRNPLFTHIWGFSAFLGAPFAKGCYRGIFGGFSRFYVPKMAHFRGFREKACFFSKTPSRLGGKKHGSFLQMSISSYFLQLRKNAVFSSCKK